MSQPSPALLKALIHLFRPLVRLLMHYQITYPYLSQLLKSLYIDEAVRMAPANDSRVSVLTGVHRKDVRRLRQLEDPLMQLEQQAASLGAEVVAYWCSLDDFIDKQGKPLSLHRLASQGEPSFETLVETVSRQDLRARSLLDEWLGKGIIQVDEDDRVSLNETAFIPSEDFNDKAYFFGRNNHDHLAAGLHNLQGEQKPFFDRCVYYNNLSQQSMESLLKLSKQQGNQLLLQLNREARKLQRQDSKQAGERYRFHFGAFQYAQQQEDDNNA